MVHRKFTTEHIRKRLSATLIEGINQELYRLIGDLHDSKHGNIYTHFKIRLHLRRYVKIYIMLVVPKELLRYCREGCPLNINEFCKMWKSRGKGIITVGCTKRINKQIPSFLI